jgi:hypothetical protein
LTGGLNGSEAKTTRFPETPGRPGGIVPLKVKIVIRSPSLFLFVLGIFFGLPLTRVKPAASQNHAPEA